MLWRIGFVAFPAAALLLACGGGAAGSPHGNATHPSDGGRDAVPDRIEVGASDAGPEVHDVDARADAEASIADAASEGGGEVDTVISDDNSGGYQNETQLAVAPDGTIAVAWQEADPIAALSVMGYRFSHDGGRTWSSIGTVPALPDGFMPSDPTVRVDSQGNFWLGLVGVAFSGTTVTNTGIFVAEAPAGKSLFGPPVRVTPTSGVYDHPKIFVLADDSLVVVFAEVQNTLRGIAARSINGTTWSLANIVTPAVGGFANLFWLCQAQGRLYATFWEYDPFQGLFAALRSSDDLGATWTQTSVQVSSASEQLAGSDPSCVASGDDVWVEYATTPMPSQDPNTTMDVLDHVRVAHSGDRGASFPASATVEAADISAGAAFLNPVLVNEPGGSLDVAYYSGKNDGDPVGSLRYTRAANAGGSFGKSVSLHAPLTYTVDRTSPGWLGDYMGVAQHGGWLNVAFADNSSGASHVVLRRTRLP